MITINETLTLDKKAIKNLLLMIYETKPNFPIRDLESLTKALGGKEQLLFINETTGDLPSSVIAKKILENIDSIIEPNQIIDGLIGDSFVDIITKAKLMDKLNIIKYPIESKNEFIKNTKDLGIFSIPIEIIAEKIDYPIERSEQILNRLKLMDKDLLNVNIDLISHIQEEDSEILEVDERISGEQFVTEIEKILNDDTKTNREKVKLIIIEGKNAYRQQRYEDALKIYDMGLTLDPEETQLKFLKNSIQQKLKDLNSLQVESSEKLKFEPEEPVETPIEPRQSQKPEKVESETELPSQEITQTPAIEQEKATTPKEESIEQSTVKLDNKLEELGKRLQEKVSKLKSLSATASELSEDVCKSCEGRGECYWCKGVGKCSKCSGAGSDDQGNSCETCKGSGTCHSCNGSGNCRWCNGSGKKKD